MTQTTNREKERTVYASIAVIEGRLDVLKHDRDWYKFRNPGDLGHWDEEISDLETQLKEALTSVEK